MTREILTEQLQTEEVFGITPTSHQQDAPLAPEFRRQRLRVAHTHTHTKRSLGWLLQENYSAAHRLEGVELRGDAASLTKRGRGKKKVIEIRSHAERDKKKN